MCLEANESSQAVHWPLDCRRKTVSVDLSITLAKALCCRSLWCSAEIVGIHDLLVKYVHTTRTERVCQYLKNQGQEIFRYFSPSDNENLSLSFIWHNGDSIVDAKFFHWCLRWISLCLFARWLSLSRTSSTYKCYSTDRYLEANGWRKASTHRSGHRTQSCGGVEDSLESFTVRWFSRSSSTGYLSWFDQHCSTDHGTRHLQMLLWHVCRLAKRYSGFSRWISFRGHPTDSFGSAMQPNHHTLRVPQTRWEKSSFDWWAVCQSTVFYSGERIEVPHRIQCQCNPCTSAGLADSLRYSQLRLSTYRALASDVYLALVSHDPIENAFQLGADLAQLIENEPNLCNEYSILFEQVSVFTARLLDHIQDQEEMDVLVTVERIQSALDRGQKEFIVHNNTQQQLRKYWYENSGLRVQRAPVKQFLVSSYYVIVFLPMYFGYFWFPGPFEQRCERYFQQPAILTLLQLISYQMFLLLLILSSAIKPPVLSFRKAYPQIFAYYHRLSSTKRLVSYLQKTVLPVQRIFLLVWMMGYVFRNVRRIIRQRRYTDVFELVMTILFLLYLILYFSTSIQFYLDWQSVLNVDTWKRLDKFHNGTYQSMDLLRCSTRLFPSVESHLLKEYGALEGQLQEKIVRLGQLDYSSPIDVRTISEGVFAVLAVICIIYECILFIPSVYVGQLFVSLLITGRPIHRLFLFFFITVIAYQTSLLHLFSYYTEDTSYGPVANHQQGNRTSRAVISLTFSGLKKVVMNVFFSLFGVMTSELTHGRVHIGHKNITLANQTDFHLLNDFTGVVGSFLHSVYTFGTRILLMTIIIAYIKRVYRWNQTQGLKNWKFIRTKLLMRYISSGRERLPVPFNLILTPWHIREFLRRRKSTKKTVEPTPSQDTNYLRYSRASVTDFNLQRKLTLEEVFNRIVMRFLTEYHPVDVHSFKRTRQRQCKEELSIIRQHTLDGIQSIQEANKTIRKHTSTFFFGLNWSQSTSPSNVSVRWSSRDGWETRGQMHIDHCHHRFLFLFCPTMFWFLFLPPAKFAERAWLTRTERNTMIFRRSSSTDWRHA